MSREVDDLLMANDIGQAMGGMMNVLGKVMGAVMQAAAEAGLSEAEMAGIKAKAQSGAALTDAEKAKVQRFGELLTPALEKIGPELGDAGAPMVAQIQGQFAQLLAQQ